jgi:hypothetical protein
MDGQERCESFQQECYSNEKIPIEVSTLHFMFPLIDTVHNNTLGGVRVISMFVALVL